MLPTGKRAPVVLLALLPLGVAVHLIFKQRFETRLAAESAERRRQLFELRAENRNLLKPIQNADTADAVLAPDQSAGTMQATTAATELLRTGLFGPFAWTRGANNSVQDEVAALADALGLTEFQKAAMLAAAEKGQREVAAAVLAGAKVHLNENAAAGPALTTGDIAERSRQMQGAPPAEQTALIARELSMQSAARGERELAIEFTESPEARAAFADMQASFALAMGNEKYAFYQAVGAARTIEGMFDEIGLQPHSLSVVRRHAGSLSASEEQTIAMMDRMRATVIASGKSPPPEFPVGAAKPNQQGTVYDFRRIRSLATWAVTVTRPGEGRGGSAQGGGNSLSGIIQQTGVGTGGPSSLSGDVLRSMLGPIQSLLPADF